MLLNYGRNISTLLTMKTYSILISLACLAATACDKADLSQIHPPSEIGSRAITPGIDSETNPDLLTDWENCDYIVLSEMAADGNLIKVTAPWKNGAQSALPGDFCNNVRKADGWIMLFHTFCKANLDPKLNYMCLYHQFTGIIKIFYYSEDNDIGTSTIWNLSSQNTKQPQSIFSDYEYFSQPINGDNEYTVWSITADNMAIEGTSGVKKGWNGFQFRIGEYNPAISSGELAISAHNAIYTNLNFNGEETSVTTGTIATINTDDKSIYNNAISKAVLNQVGDKAKSAVDKFASKNLDKNFLGLNIKDIVSKFTAGNYAGAIASGLGCVFKGLTKKEPSYSISEVSLKTQGTLTLSGVGQTSGESVARPLKFNLCDILNGRKLSAPPIKTLATNHASNIELGVWNLRNKPTIYYERYTKFKNQVPIPSYEEPLLNFHGMCDYPNTTIGDINIVFNPAIKDYIKSYSASAKIIDVVGGNRKLSHTGKNKIAYNTLNNLTSNNGVTIYGVDHLERSLNGMVENRPESTPLTDNTTYYIDWGTNVAGYRAAVVTLTMNIDYNGKEYSFTESRVYDVDYAPSTYPNSSVVNNPPYSYLLNSSDNHFYGFYF